MPLFSRSNNASNSFIDLVSARANDDSKAPRSRGNNTRHALNGVNERLRQQPYLAGSGRLSAGEDSPDAGAFPHTPNSHRDRRWNP
jgi:hypothetical protein